MRQEESLQFLESLHFLTGSHRVLRRTVFLDYGNEFIKNKLWAPCLFCSPPPPRSFCGALNLPLIRRNGEKSRSHSWRLREKTNGWVVGRPLKRRASRRNLLSRKNPATHGSPLKIHDGKREKPGMADRQLRIRGISLNLRNLNRRGCLAVGNRVVRMGCLTSETVSCHGRATKEKRGSVGMAPAAAAVTSHQPPSPPPHSTQEHARKMIR